MAGMRQGVPSFGLTMEIDEAGCTNTTEVHFHLNCQILVVLIHIYICVNDITVRSLIIYYLIRHKKDHFFIMCNTF